MIEDPEFKHFPKIPRLENELITITEKIDGSNGVICVWKDVQGLQHIKAGSRNQWLTEENNNFQFYQFVMDNAVELIEGLGEGYHYGEWFGMGINRNYSLKERRFALFNTHRWSDSEVRPKCCSVVPTLYVGPLSVSTIKAVTENLYKEGSIIVPGYSNPEGVVVYCEKTGKLYKNIIE